MNYYLFAVLCMFGVIAILGFFSFVIYLSGMIMGSVKEKKSGEETREIRIGEGEGERKEPEMKTMATEDAEEELKKVAAIAAVVAMAEGEQKEKMPEKRKREARYPSPWMVVRE
ncbi:MAG: hypothetical protein SVE93_00970 [Candidatus Thermoplasmatota archaeon]|nr:hypothetical protein [Candidatus Thermoplasmatota archaeon]